MALDQAAVKAETSESSSSSQRQQRLVEEIDKSVDIDSLHDEDALGRAMHLIHKEVHGQVQEIFNDLLSYNNPIFKEIVPLFNELLEVFNGFAPLPEDATTSLSVTGVDEPDDAGKIDQL